MVPGFGQVYAIGLSAAALLHYLGSKVGATAVKRSLEASRFKLTAPEQSAIDTAYFIDVLKHGRSIVIVQTKFRDVAAEATAILDRLGLGKQTPTHRKREAPRAKWRASPLWTCAVRLTSETEAQRCGKLWLI
jgi:hypothetical protein